MIKINYLNFLVISQHYRVTIKEFIVVIFVSHTSPKTRNFCVKLRSAKARPHSVKTSLHCVVMTTLIVSMSQEQWMSGHLQKGHLYTLPHGCIMDCSHCEAAGISSEL